MTALRTDRCPGVLRLHEAADGWLARIRLPGGRIRSGGLRAVAAVADRGNGIIELTSRASLQVRGLSASDAAAAAELLHEARLLPSPEHDLARNILASPLAGRHPRSVAAIDPIVQELDRLICEDPAMAALPGRFLFGVDDGSGVGAGPTPVVGLVAKADDRFRLQLRGVDAARSADARGAAALALGAARQLLRGELGPVEGAAPGVSAAAIEPGMLTQRDGLLALTALPPLGRVTPALARALSDCAGELRLSCARTFTVVDLDKAAAARLRRRLAALGLVDDPASGWRGLSACAGLGACARALADVRAEAQTRAVARGAESPREHWSACPRRCGRPAGAHVGFVATAEGILREEVG